MQCPVCPSAQLLLSERQGIEIDYCPQCRGVWLDRGELDKLIERGSVASAPAQAAAARHADQGPRYGQGHGHGHGQHAPARGDAGNYREHDGWGNRPRHKKKSFLGEIFDFD